MGKELCGLTERSPLLIYLFFLFVLRVLTVTGLMRTNIRDPEESVNISASPGVGGGRGLHRWFVF